MKVTRISTYGSRQWAIRDEAGRWGYGRSALPDGTSYEQYYFRTKREALAALAAMQQEKDAQAMTRDDHCTHPEQTWCDCDWCRIVRAAQPRKGR